MNTHQHQAMPLNPKSLRTKFALRFLRALRNINHQKKMKKKATHHHNGPFMVAQRYLKVKVAAEASMASAVGPRRAWSRAMLIRVRAQPTGLQLHAPAARRETLVMVRRRRRYQRRAWPRRETQAHEQLRRLVPGGEAMDLKSLLSETAHYVKCLSTQVKVMRSIVNYCSPSTT